MSTKPAKPRKPAPRPTLTGAVALAAALVCSGAQAGPVGQTWRVFPDESAPTRDYLGRAQVRAVVWYPSAGGVAERVIAIGPPGATTFAGGAAAPEAPMARGGRRPLILMSHGAGGTALQYGWLGSDLARRGYVVVAVDHPGASGGERSTDPGAYLWWRRADDITAALDGVLADPVLGHRVDPRRIGLVGYSMGGATGLLLAGARPSVAAMRAACMTMKNAACAALPQVEGEAGLDRSDARIDAFALIAPGPAPLLELSTVRKAQAVVIAGDADQVTAPSSNAIPAAAALGGRVHVLPGVGHNDFLQPCTEAGSARYPDLCAPGAAPREETRATTAKLIGDFFATALRR